MCEPADGPRLRGQSLAAACGGSAAAGVVRRPEVVIVEESDRDIESILRGEMYAYLHGHDYRLHAWYAPSLIFERVAAS